MITWPVIKSRRLLCTLYSRFVSSASHQTAPVSNRVYWLASGDIYRNLAFETTLFNRKERYVVDKKTTTHSTRAADIIMWRSNPCVVIGRNQLVWLETNPREVEGRGWQLARRMSGGGAVFHDAGNLNVSFLEARSIMSRRKCMQFLQSTLTTKWPRLNILVGPRHDLWLLPKGFDADPDSKEVRVHKRQRTFDSLERISN